MPGSTQVLRTLVPLLALAICAALLLDRISTIDLRALSGAIRDIPVTRLAAAAALTAFSLWSVGRYDIVAHRHLGTGQTATDAANAGTTAIALAQTLGFGVLTGALVRWRMLPGLSATGALTLSALVSVWFMTGLAVLAAFCCLVLPAPPFTFWPALVTILCMPFVIALVVLVPVVRVAQHRVRMPSLRALLAILFWTFLDTLAAAAALFVLLPNLGFGFAAFYPIFLLALGAGLALGTPGGVGPFELALFALLPLPVDLHLLAGLACFRVIYYAGPAVLALLALSRPCPRRAPEALIDWRILQHAPRAEVGVIRQNGGMVRAWPGGVVALWPCPQTLVALFDPVQGSLERLMQPLLDAARDRNLGICLYKVSARVASVARRHGWQVSHIADEATLNPGNFDLQTPSRRRLRRKLGSARRSAIEISQPDVLPVQHLADIDRAWQSAHGTARGGSVGRFCAAYLAHQSVFVAWQDREPIAYISVHVTSQEWCLDLMRHRPNVPDGAMHALVYQALLAAKQEGIARFSLAATPACPDPESALMRWGAAQVAARSGAPGLRQFKSTFAPLWCPLYAAAPGPLRLALALADIARTIWHPTPVVTDWPTAGQRHPHNEDEYYEVASTNAA